MKRFSERIKEQKFSSRRRHVGKLLKAGRSISEDILKDGDLLKKLKSIGIWRLKSTALDLYVYDNGLLEKHGVSLNEFLLHVRDLVHHHVEKNTNGSLRLFCRFHSSNIRRSVYEDVMFGTHTTKSWDGCDAVGASTITLCSGGAEMAGMPSIEAGSSQPGCAALKRNNHLFREDVMRKIQKRDVGVTDAIMIFTLFDDQEIEELKPLLPAGVREEVDAITRQISEAAARILQHTSDRIRRSALGE